MAVCNSTLWKTTDQQFNRGQYSIEGSFCLVSERAAQLILQSECQLKEVTTNKNICHNSEFVHVYSFSPHYTRLYIELFD